jgi:hypothetical protein
MWAIIGTGISLLLIVGVLLFWPKPKIIATFQTETPPSELVLAGGIERNENGDYVPSQAMQDAHAASEGDPLKRVGLGKTFFRAAARAETDEVRRSAKMCALFGVIANKLKENPPTEDDTNNKYLNLLERAKAGDPISFKEVEQFFSEHQEADAMAKQAMSLFPTLIQGCDALPPDAVPTSFGYGAAIYDIESERFLQGDLTGKMSAEEIYDFLRSDAGKSSMKGIDGFYILQTSDCSFKLISLKRTTTAVPPLSTISANGKYYVFDDL